MKNFLFGVIFCGLLLHTFQGSGQSQLTNLPTLYITTDNNRTIDDKKTWVPGSLKVVAGEDVPEGLYDGRIEIRGRGNATWEAPKKPYRIRLASKYKLLGMPSEARNWVLLANYFDNSLVRNALAFEVSKFLGFEYTCAYRFVDVFLNGNYIGNYTLTDHVQVENNRVDVEKLDASDTELPAISGGYFVQEELYAPDEDEYFQIINNPFVSKYAIKYPDSDDINSQQRSYIRNYIQNYQDRLYSNDFLHPENGYNALVDRTSQVNWQIANELTANYDSYLSVYLYKKRNDPKLYFGPLWDHDKAFNNSERFPDMSYLSLVEKTVNTEKIKRMLLDPGFNEAMKVRWKALRSAGLYEHLDSKLVAFSQELMDSQVLNFALPNIAEGGTSVPFLTRIEALRSFLKRRVAYLDYHLTGEIENGRHYKIAGSTQRQPIRPGSDSDHSIAPRDEDEADLWQEWIILPDGSGEENFYKIKNRHNGLLLSREGNSVIAKAEHEDLFNLQRWKIEKIENQPYAAILTPPGPDRRALAHEGQSITLNTNLNNFPTSGSRRWFFIPTSPNNTSLPVRVSSFSAAVQEEAIELSWNVTEASGFDRFAVERTADPVRTSGMKIGEVFLREDIEGRYVFLDPDPEAGINYYRLKMIDKDGTFSYTHYVSAEHSGIARFNAYPVPAGSELNISFRSDAYRGPASVMLLSSAGNAALIQGVDILQGVNHIRLGVGNLSPGVYHLKMSLPDQLLLRRVIIAE